MDPTCLCLMSCGHFRQRLSLTWVSDWALADGAASAWGALGVCTAWVLTAGFEFATPELVVSVSLVSWPASADGAVVPRLAVGVGAARVVKTRDSVAPAENRGCRLIFWTFLAIKTKSSWQNLEFVYNFLEFFLQKKLEFFSNSLSFPGIPVVFLFYFFVYQFLHYTHYDI